MQCLAAVQVVVGYIYIYIYGILLSYIIISIYLYRLFTFKMQSIHGALGYKYVIQRVHHYSAHYTSAYPDPLSLCLVRCLFLATGAAGARDHGGEQKGKAASQPG